MIDIEREVRAVFRAQAAAIDVSEPSAIPLHSEPTSSDRPSQRTARAVTVGALDDDSGANQSLRSGWAAVAAALLIVIGAGSIALVITRTNESAAPGISSSEATDASLQDRSVDDVSTLPTDVPLPTVPQPVVTLPPVTSPPSVGPTTQLPAASTKTTGCLYEVVEGDKPSIVADRFNVTVDQLNLANADNAAYQHFMLGDQLFIPAFGVHGEPCGEPPAADTPLYGDPNIGATSQRFLNAGAEIRAAKDANPALSQMDPVLVGPVDIIQPGAVTVEVQLPSMSDLTDVGFSMPGDVSEHFDFTLFDIEPVGADDGMVNLVLHVTDVRVPYLGFHLWIQ